MCVLHSDKILELHEAKLNPEALTQTIRCKKVHLRVKKKQQQEISPTSKKNLTRSRQGNQKSKKSDAGQNRQVRPNKIQAA